MSWLYLQVPFTWIIYFSSQLSSTKSIFLPLFSGVYQFLELLWYFWKQKAEQKITGEILCRKQNISVIWRSEYVSLTMRLFILMSLFYRESGKKKHTNNYPKKEKIAYCNSQEGKAPGLKYVHRSGACLFWGIQKGVTSERDTASPYKWTSSVRTMHF